jgi:hypothetical protein
MFEGDLPTRAKNLVIEWAKANQTKPNCWKFGLLRNSENCRR